MSGLPSHYRRFGPPGSKQREEQVEALISELRVSLRECDDMFYSKESGQFRSKYNSRPLLGADEHDNGYDFNLWLRKNGNKKKDVS